MEDLAVTGEPQGEATLAAPGRDISPKELLIASGIGRTFLYQLLTELVAGEVIAKVAHGCYRRLPGQSAEAALAGRHLP